MAQAPILLQGNEAVAEGAIAAGARFFAGYPITPSTEIAERLSRRLPEVGGTFIQMEDEIASIAAVCGASLAGAKALTATSGPGFSLMQEMIGFAEMAQIPCVIVDVMRGGPSTGLPTEPSQGDVMQARWGTHGEHSVIALVPNSVLECYTLTIQAFNLSEQFRTPVILLSDALIGHMREAVVLPEPGSLRIAERGVPDCDPDDYDTVVSTLDHILPRPPLATSAATCARRSTTTVTPSCASRPRRWKTPRSRSSPTARCRGRRAPSCAGRAHEGCRWAWCGRSRCGRSRRRRWSSCRARCAPSSSPR
jgi:pyruvate/2-oxoacid:ferredoxin oxidoreductase alpha subunit